MVYIKTPDPMFKKDDAFIIKDPSGDYPWLGVVIGIYHTHYIAKALYVPNEYVSVWDQTRIPFRLQEFMSKVEDEDLGKAKTSLATLYNNK